MTKQTTTLDIAALLGNNLLKSGSSEKANAQVWLNIGYTSPQGFIPMPYNLAIDTMPKRKAASGEYGQRLAASNALLEALLKAAEGLQPGQSASVQLEVQLYRNKAAETAPAEGASIPDLGFKLITG